MRRAVSSILLLVTAALAGCGSDELVALDRVALQRYIVGAFVAGALKG